jgi:hypothetical protein
MGQLLLSLHAALIPLDRVLREGGRLEHMKNGLFCVCNVFFRF